MIAFAGRGFVTSSACSCRRFSVNQNSKVEVVSLYFNAKGMNATNPATSQFLRRTLRNGPMLMITCAQINLDNLSQNINAVRKKVFPAFVIPVIKADAYGHGAVEIAKHLVMEGINFFAVAKFEEAMELRHSGITKPILIFGRLFENQISEAIKADFRITLFCVQDIKWIQKTAKDKQAKVHVKLETGMGRVGLIKENEPDFFDLLEQTDSCLWEGLYSHFSTSDCKDKTYADIQLAKFRKFICEIKTKKKQPLIIHIANSGAILDIPQSYFNAVRPGIIMYGHYPSKQTSQSIPLKQVMTFKTHPAHIRRLPADHPVSYAKRWITPKPVSIAVLPAGYADGIRRDLTNKGEVLIRGKKYYMVGTITMDQTMVNIENDPVKITDEVIIWGDSIQLIDVAAKIGTIPYELLTGVSKRVKRVYE